jgi:hypothetical protein
MMDVGVDGNGLYPIDMSEVLSIMRKKATNQKYV